MHIAELKSEMKICIKTHAECNETTPAFSFGRFHKDSKFTNIDVKCSPKGVLGATGWTPNFQNIVKSVFQIHLRQYLEKNCPRRPKPAPPIFKKLCFVDTKPLFSGFHLCCDMSAKVSPSSVRLGYFRHQNVKKHFLGLLQKSTKKHITKT